MSMSPVIRVVLSNMIEIVALAAVWYGYGPVLLIAAIVAHVYLHRILRPRIPEFTGRGHSLAVRFVWYSLVISLAAVYFGGESGFLSPSTTRLYFMVVVPIFFLGCFADDVRYARILARG